MSPKKPSFESTLSSKSPNRLRGANKLTAVLAIGLGVAGLTACASAAEGPKPTPTETSVIETEAPIKAPEMKPYILNSDQVNSFDAYMNSSTEDEAYDAMTNYGHVIGETIIPATQAYIDNLMLNRDNLTSVDTSSISDNPNSPIISRLMSLVQTQGGEPEITTKFYVCSVERETSPNICKEQGRRATSIFNGARPELGIVDDSDTLSIVRTTGNDPFGAREDSNISIFIGNGQTIGITDKNQIVYK